MRVVHVSPTYFGPESCVGGGERFAEELSRVMSARVDVRFVSFGARYRRESWSRTYERVILKAQPVMGRQSKMAPWSAALIREVWSADADALPEGRVHFGYRDGIAQPRIDGAPGRQPDDMQSVCPAGGRRPITSTSLGGSEPTCRSLGMRRGGSRAGTRRTM